MAAVAKQTASPPTFLKASYPPNHISDCLRLPLKAVLATHITKEVGEKRRI